ncbi:MAG: HAD-IIB family hydrolase [Candidatus Pacebacteria bacterium]|nr:HAD-IIB family hydrolase [Candidatus Paceibacterota bacterium]
MLNKEIPQQELNKLKMVVLDSDGVSLPRGTDILEKEGSDFYQAVIKTNKITDRLAEKLNRLKKRMKVCVSSGRGLIYLQSMYGKILGEGTILQAENGNLSLIEGRIMQHFEYKEKYFKKLATIREEIKKLPIKGFEPKQFIMSVHAEREIPEVYEIVKRNDPENELKVMWNGEAFDIQKKIVSKGEGLKRLMQELKIQKEETIAIGDRINDKELIEVAGIGISADADKLKADYWTTGEELGGEVLVEYLLKNLNL